MRTVIIASMRTYARRYVAALLAIVIATGFIVSINALSAAAREGSRQAVTQQYGRADLAVTGAGEPTAFATLARRAAADPGVAAVATSWASYAGVRFPDGPQDVSLGSIATAPALRWQQAASGRLPSVSSNDEVALSTSSATAHDVSVGDTVTLSVGGEDRRLTVTGTVEAAGGPLTASLYLPETSFEGRDTIGFPLDLVIATSGDAGAVADRLDRVAGDATVMTGAAYLRDQWLQATQGIDIFAKLIFVFAGISLFVGALVIANTFTILLAQRSRDLALLRCVGALRAQVARSVVAEGALLGVIGSLLGVALGYGISLLGVVLIHGLSPDTPMGTPALTLGAVLVPALLGIAVTAAAAYAPAQRAGAQSPLAALNPQDVVEIRSRSGAVRLAAAAVLLLVGGAALVLGIGGSLPVGMVGGMLSFIGVLLLTPVLVPTAIRAAGPVARRLGLAGRLAHLNSLRNPRRTAATSTALLIGVTLITSVVVGASSISHKVNTSLDTNHPIDLMVTAADRAVPDQVVDEVRDVDGASRVAALPGRTAEVGDDTLTVLGADADALALVHGDDGVGELAADEILLPPSSTALPVDEPGTTVTVRTSTGPQQLTARFVSGIGDAAIVRASTLDTMGGATSTRAVWLRAADDADPREIMSAVSAIGETSDLNVSGGLTERADILKILDVVLAVTVGLLAIAVLIALIGVGNTLSLSVLERVRENSLLRALGLDRSGLRAMLALEALLMAGVSAVLGVGLGTAYAWFGVKTASIGVFATSPSLTMPWGQIALILLVAALAGLAACVLPARRAARIAPAAGLVAD